MPANHTSETVTSDAHGVLHPPYASLESPDVGSCASSFASCRRRRPPASRQCGGNRPAWPDRGASLFRRRAVKCRQSWRVGGPERSDPARPAPPVAPEGALPPVLRRQCAEHVQRLIAVSLQTSMQSESPVGVRTTVTGRSLFRKVPSPPRAGEGQLRLACESLSGTRRNVCYAASARLPSALCQARGPGRIEYPGRITDSHGRLPVAQAADKGACGVWIVRSCPGGSPGMHQ